MALILFNLNDDIGIMNFGTRDSSSQSDYLPATMKKGGPGMALMWECVHRNFHSFLSAFQQDWNFNLPFITLLILSEKRREMKSPEVFELYLNNN